MSDSFSCNLCKFHHIICTNTKHLKNYFHGLLNKEGGGGGGGGNEKKRSSVACLSVDWRLSCPVQTTALRVLQPKTHTPPATNLGFSLPD